MQNVYCMLQSLDTYTFPVTCRDLGRFLGMLHACNKHVAIYEHACEIHVLAMHCTCTGHAPLRGSFACSLNYCLHKAGQWIDNS